MMEKCSFCSREGAVRIAGLRLCKACLMQLAHISPQSAAYGWYVSAVRRALFEEAG